MSVPPPQGYLPTDLPGADEEEPMPVLYQLDVAERWFGIVSVDNLCR
jgi:hypothetical protein